MSGKTQNGHPKDVDIEKGRPSFEADDTSSIGQKPHDTSDIHSHSKHSSTEASKVILTLQQFRVLTGIPQQAVTRNGSRPPGMRGSGGGGADSVYRKLESQSLIQPPTIRTMPMTRSRALVFLRLLPSPKPSSDSRRIPFWSRSAENLPINEFDEQAEYPTSLYYSLVLEECDQARLYHFYNMITYLILILQLVIAAALIIVGAIPRSGNSEGIRIAIAVLGGMTGILTGAISLLKGQGLPNRFLQFSSRLRKLREEIEFQERTLRAGLHGVYVTYQDVLDLFDEYEKIILERDINRPDAWATVSSKKEAKTNIKPATAQHHAIPSTTGNFVTLSKHQIPNQQQHETRSEKPTSDDNVKEARGRSQQRRLVIANHSESAVSEHNHD